jgi:tetratricopeptide (TPR) repeat protein
VKVEQVARELGVRYVLEGSVRRAVDQIRINAQLIDANTGGHLWAERYDGNLADIFDLQDQINQKIVTALAVQLTADEQERVTRKDTDNIAAHDALVAGLGYLLRFTPADLARATAYFEEAVELDPAYSRAWAALANSLYWAATVGWNESLPMPWRETPSHVVRLRAIHYLERSMKNPNAAAYRLRVGVNLGRRLYDEALADAERAVALAPNHPGAHVAMAKALLGIGRSDEAIAFAKKAARLDPRYTYISLVDLGAAYYQMERWADAVTYLERVLKYNPEWWWVDVYLAPAYAHLGRDRDAQDALARWRDNPWKWPPNLRAAMSVFHGRDPQAVRRHANGLLKAGLPGEPGGYYKILEENRLIGAEIQDLVFGRTVTIKTGEENVRIHRTKDGKSIYQGSEGNIESKSWIEGDTLCDQWSKPFDDLKNCGTVFRNPEGSKNTFDEYLLVTDIGGLAPFSTED